MSNHVLELLEKRRDKLAERPAVQEYQELIETIAQLKNEKVETTINGEVSA